MPSLKNDALLMTLEAFRAQNNIRFGLLTAAVNVQGSDEGLSDRSKILDPAEVFTFPVIPGNKGTVVRCTGPLQVTLTNTAGSMTFLVSSLFVFTDSITGLTLTHPGASGSSPVRIHVLHI